MKMYAHKKYYTSYILHLRLRRNISQHISLVWMIWKQGPCVVAGVSRDPGQAKQILLFQLKLNVRIGKTQKLLSLKTQ